MDGMNVQVGAASATVQAAVLRRLCARRVGPMSIGVTAQMMAPILEVVIDAVAHRCAALRQGQMRRIGGKETHVGELVRSLASVSSRLDDHTMKRMVLRLQ